MHETMARLYRAAMELKGIDTPSDLARALTETSPQTVKNWESRGISKGGMLDAERRIGCRASWLETGVGPMAVEQRSDAAGAPPPAPGRGLDPKSAGDPMERIEQALNDLLIIDGARDEVMDLVRAKAHHAASLQRVILERVNSGYDGPERRSTVRARMLVDPPQQGTGKKSA